MLAIYTVPNTSAARIFGVGKITVFVHDKYFFTHISHWDTHPREANTHIMVPAFFKYLQGLSLPELHCIYCFFKATRNRRVRLKCNTFLLCLLHTLLIRRSGVSIFSVLHSAATSRPTSLMFNQYRLLLHCVSKPGRRVGNTTTISTCLHGWVLS